MSCLLRHLVVRCAAISGWSASQIAQMVDTVRRQHPADIPIDPSIVDAVMATLPVSHDYAVKIARR